MNVTGVYDSAIFDYYYLRQEGNQVVGFGHRNDGAWATVLTGAFVNPTEIHLDYYFNPIGQAQGNGTLIIRIDPDQADLVVEVTTGNLNLKKLIPTSLPTQIPPTQAAQYTGTDQNDLTGRWLGRNMGATWFTQHDNNLFGISLGLKPQPHDRPYYASVIIGERQGNNVNLNWYDIPLGYNNCHATAKLEVTGPDSMNVRDSFFFGNKQDRK